ncbi:MAG: hypothetical protein ACR2G7_13630 [Acidimicrobiales bacterium]
MEVIVVDGSVPELFAAHRRSWAAAVRQVPVDADSTDAMARSTAWSPA